jgi:hypothetical protein
LAFAALLFSVQLISPQGSSYSVILLSLVLIGIFWLKPKKLFWASLILVFLIANVPVSLFQSLPLVFRFPRLLLLIVFFIVTVYSFNVKLKAQWSFVLLLLTGAPKMISYQSETDSSKRFVDKEMNSLIINYGEKNQHLSYTYWSEGGEKVMDTTIPIDSLTDANTSIRNNQIFYQDKQLTHSSDNKKNARMINSKEIIYLSDKGKGIGFYAIRKIAIP